MHCRICHKDNTIIEYNFGTWRKCIFLNLRHTRNRERRRKRMVNKIKVCVVDDNRELVNLFEEFIRFPRGYGSMWDCS